MLQKPWWLGCTTVTSLTLQVHCLTCVLLIDEEGVLQSKRPDSRRRQGHSTVWRC